jgi:prepilin-type processing-associated H-X9-DG protein
LPFALTKIRRVARAHTHALGAARPSKSIPSQLQRGIPYPMTAPSLVVIFLYEPPSQMIAVGDSYGAREYGGTDFFLAVKHAPWSQAAPFRHGHHLNMAFCDGHVETRKASQWFERSEAARRIWNFDNQPHPEIWEAGN